MPTYSYRCENHGSFEYFQKMKDRSTASCPECDNTCQQIITHAPGLDMEAMARLGMPTAFEVVGDRITKRHKDAGQY